MMLHETPIDVYRIAEHAKRQAFKSLVSKRKGLMTPLLDVCLSCMSIPNETNCLMF